TIETACTHQQGVESTRILRVDAGTQNGVVSAHEGGKVLAKRLEQAKLCDGICRRKPVSHEDDPLRLRQCFFCFLPEKREWRIPIRGLGAPWSRDRWDLSRRLGERFDGTHALVGVTACGPVDASVEFEYRDTVRDRFFVGERYGERVVLDFV